jgi:hypothetical protein
MVMLTLAEAAKLVGRDKSTLLRQRRRGQLSAVLGNDNVWRISEEELRRSYPIEDDTPRHREETPRHPAAMPEVGNGDASHIVARLNDALDQVRDLRERLDRSEVQRGAAEHAARDALAKLATVLSERSSPAPGWWGRWRRRRSRSAHG